MYLSPAKGQEIAAQLLIALDEEIERLRAFPDDVRQLKKRFDREIELLDSGAYFPGVERYRGLITPELPVLFDHLPADALVIWADPERAQSQIARLGDENLALHQDDILEVPPSVANWDLLGERAARFTPFRGARWQRRRRANFARRRARRLRLTANWRRLGDWIKERQHEGKILVCATSHARRVREILADQKIRSRPLN